MTHEEFINAIKGMSVIELMDLVKALEAEFGVKHLPSDFKKHNGYLRSLQLSEEYGLYRQDYCGCEFSAKARGIKK